jgi:hypothetical protein
MVQCRATKANGERCTLAANGPQGVCWAHDPANAAKRSRMASKAARSKPSGEIAGIKDRISVLADDVLSGKVDKGVAAVASQVLNIYLRAITVELKVRELTELEERLAALEAQGGRR